MASAPLIAGREASAVMVSGAPPSPEPDCVAGCATAAAGTSIGAVAAAAVPCRVAVGATPADAGWGAGEVAAETGALPCSTAWAEPCPATRQPAVDVDIGATGVDICSAEVGPENGTAPMVGEAAAACPPARQPVAAVALVTEEAVTATELTDAFAEVSDGASAAVGAGPGAVPRVDVSDETDSGVRGNWSGGPAGAAPAGLVPVFEAGPEASVRVSGACDTSAGTA